MIILTTISVAFNIAANAQVAVQWAAGLAIVVLGFGGILWIISRFLRMFYS